MNHARKKHICNQAREMLAAGGSLRQAASNLGLEYPGTLSRWLANENKPARRKGRPPGIEFDEESARLAKWWLLHAESRPRAVVEYIRDERAPLEIRRALQAILEHCEHAGRDPDFPTSVRRAFSVHDIVKARFESRKAENAMRMTRRRGMIWEDEAGMLHDILPYQAWEMDDYSTNQPYAYYDKDSGEWRLGRQVLAARDVMSGGWLAFEMIGRERDAYRGEDIARFIGRMVKAAGGLPMFLRLERGIWEKSCVHGIKVAGLAKRWGDLGELMQIDHVFSPQAKGGLEGAFNYLQRVLRFRGRELGRYRGNYEEATRDWMKAKRTGANPLDLGFLTQAEADQNHLAAALEINAMSKRRKCYNERVSSDDLVRRHGKHVMPVKPEDEWRFLPFKEPVTVLNGKIKVKPEGYNDIEFQINGAHSNLLAENGLKVLVAYDPQNVAAGAYVCNGTPPGHAKNRDGWPLGAFICQAPELGEVAQFTRGVGRDTHKQKAANQAVSMRFSAVMDAGKVATVRDSSGNSTTIRQGMDALALPEPGDVATPRDDAATASRGMRGGRAGEAAEPCARGRLSGEKLAELERLAYGAPATEAEAEILF